MHIYIYMYIYIYIYIHTYHYMYIYINLQSIPWSDEFLGFPSPWLRRDQSEALQKDLLEAKLAGWFISWKILLKRMRTGGTLIYFRNPPYIYIYIYTRVRSTTYVNECSYSITPQRHSLRYYFGSFTSSHGFWLQDSAIHFWWSCCRFCSAGGCSASENTKRSSWVFPKCRQRELPQLGVAPTALFDGITVVINLFSAQSSGW